MDGLLAWISKPYHNNLMIPQSHLHSLLTLGIDSKVKNEAGVHSPHSKYPWHTHSFYTSSFWKYIMRRSRALTALRLKNRLLKSVLESLIEALDRGYEKVCHVSACSNGSSMVKNTFKLLKYKLVPKTELSKNMKAKTISNLSFF